MTTKTKVKELVLNQHRVITEIRTTRAHPVDTAGEVTIMYGYDRNRRIPSRVLLKYRDHACKICDVLSEEEARNRIASLFERLTKGEFERMTIDKFWELQRGQPSMFR